MIQNFVLRELGVGINTYGYVQAVLSDIVSSYLQRCRDIKEYGLEPLDEKLSGLDRNKDEKVNEIREFIYDKYGKNVGYMLCPSYTRHDIIDYMMKIL